MLHGVWGNVEVGGPPMHFPGAIPVKTQFDFSPAQKGQKTYLGACLGGDDQVKGLFPEMTEKGNPVLETAFALKCDEPVNARLVLDHLVGERLQHPGQMCLRESPAKYIHQAQGMNRVSDS